MPSFQTALGHGIQPSLSVDVECNMTANMFSIMRATFTLQRALVNERSLAAEQNLPPLITCRQVIEMATIAGARAAHLDRKIGSLTPGKEADLLLLEQLDGIPTGTDEDEFGRHCVALLRVDVLDTHPPSAVVLTVQTHDAMLVTQ